MSETHAQSVRVEVSDNRAYVQMFLTFHKAKTDAEFVHRLSTAEASLKVWSYVIMPSENVAQLVLYGTFASTKAIIPWFDHKVWEPCAITIFTAIHNKLSNA